MRSFLSEKPIAILSEWEEVMEIKEFITLKTIVETGSFTKASEKLHYAQSTITSHIKTLEEEFGNEIFERNGKKISLTTFGKEVYMNSLSLLKAYDKIKNIPNERTIPSGKLFIGTPESVMVYKLYPVIKEFRKRFPQINIIIKSGLCTELKKSVINGKLDLCFLLEDRSTVVENENLEFIYYHKEPMCIVTSMEMEENFLRKDEEYNILNTEKGCYYRNMFTEFLLKNNISYKDSLQTESVELIKKYVMCNLGISFLPFYSIKEEVKEKKLKAIFPEEKYDLYIAMAYGKNKWISPAIEEFIKVVNEFLKDS